MSLRYLGKFGLPVAAAIAVSAAVAAPALAAPGQAAGTGTFKTWPKAQQEAGFSLLKPGTTYGLRNVGHVVVSACEISQKKRTVSAYYGSIMHASLSLTQNNAGRNCAIGSFPGTFLGTYRIHGVKASMFGYCGTGVEPACSSSDIAMWLSWKVKGDYYTASSHDETRARLAHFAATLVPATPKKKR
jgi:hypothetical protein